MATHDTKNYKAQSQFYKEQENNNYLCKIIEELSRP